MGGKEQVLIDAIRNGDALAAIKLLTKNCSVIKNAGEKSNTAAAVAKNPPEMTYPSKKKSI
jgi:hypothetical protein